MTDPFDDPGPIEAIKWVDYENRLILLTPLEVKRDQPNFDGTGLRDVTFGDVVVLDGPGAPEVHHGTPIYPALLQGQIRSNIGTGRSNLGRLGKDGSRQKRGQSAPWILGAPTDADKKIARAYLASYQASQHSASRAPAASSTTDTSTTFSTEPPF